MRWPSNSSPFKKSNLSFWLSWLRVTLSVVSCKGFCKVSKMAETLPDLERFLSFFFLSFLCFLEDFDFFDFFDFLYDFSDFTFSATGGFSRTGVLGRGGSLGLRLFKSSKISSSSS